MIPPVVDIAWLRERTGVVLADVRHYLDGRSGREAYASGHLPGALFVDLDAQLASHEADASAGRHPLPDPETFAAEMASLGIGDDDTVVAYDDQGGIMAARLVWMLRSTDHAAALLDGGIQAWDGGPLETDTPPRPPARFSARPFARVASIDDAADPANVVVDARQPERFHGAPDPLDVRFGHIPGAHSLPCREHLDEDGRLRPVEELRAALDAVGIDGEAAVVSYCGSGVTACHNLLVIEHAGLGSGRLYPGSWSQWSRDSARPIEL